MHQIVEMMKRILHYRKIDEYLDIKLGLRTTMFKDWKFGMTSLLELNY